MFSHSPTTKFGPRRMLSTLSQTLLACGLLGLAIGSTQQAPELSVASQLSLLFALLLGAGLTAE